MQERSEIRRFLIAGLVFVLLLVMIGYSWRWFNLKERYLALEENCEYLIGQSNFYRLEYDSSNCKIQNPDVSNVFLLTDIDNNIESLESDIKNSKQLIIKELPELDGIIDQNNELLKCLGKDTLEIKLGFDNQPHEYYYKQNLIADQEKELEDIENQIKELEENLKDIFMTLGIQNPTLALVTPSSKATYQEYCKDYANQINSLNQKYDPDLIQEISKYKYFSGLEFQKLYDNLEPKLANLKKSEKNYQLYGNQQVDGYIFNIAENRGYKKRYEAEVSNLVKQDGYLMQEKAAKQWSELVVYAKENGYDLGLVSAYRSPNSQQTIFVKRLDSAGFQDFTYNQVLNRKADIIINEVLSTSSVPGYSKHHSGYAIDIEDKAYVGNFTAFDQTEAYKWLKKNNYLNLKKFGFIPSYPEGQVNAGPIPEAWEYVYVGREVLTK